MRDETKKCLCENCEDCNWFRYKQLEKVQDGKPTGVCEMVRVCMFEYYFDALNFMMGSYDGLQEGINDARNRSMEAKAATESFRNEIFNIMRQGVMNRLYTRNPTITINGNPKTKELDGNGR
jgi:hypothetical protein